MRSFRLIIWTAEIQETGWLLRGPLYSSPEEEKGAKLKCWERKG